MTDCTDFAARVAALGVDLPDGVVLAVERYRAVDRAIREIAADPVADLDVTTLEPDQAAGMVAAVIAAEQRRQLVHANVVLRLRDRANTAAMMAIGAAAEEIVGSLRRVHDRLAAQLADTAGLLHGLDHSGIAQADTSTRMVWAERPGLNRRMRELRTLREVLAEWGYRADYSDLTGRQLEQLTRYVDVPRSTTWQQVVDLYGLADEHRWDDVLHTGARLWLPPLGEQRQRIEQLRALKGQRTTRATVVAS